MRQRGGSEQPVKGRRANRPKARKGSTATSSMADLQRQIGTLTRELKEANDRQTATAEVLRIVASSPEDLQPVFDAMLEKAIALCQAKFGTLFLYDGKAFSIVADRNLPPEYAQVLRGKSFSPEANSGFRRLVESKAPVHLTDMFADSSYARGEPLRIAAVELGGVRSLVAVPMLKKGELIGNFSIYRGEAGGFAENQIALVKAFADQAVIAIENARLFNEVQAKTRDLEESLEQESATSEVLKLISMFSDNVEPVFQKMLENATRVCEAEFGIMNLVANGMVVQASFYNMPASYVDAWRDKPYLAHPQSVMGTVMRTRRVVHVDDLRTSPAYLAGAPAVVALADIAGARTYVGVPMEQREARPSAE